MSNKNSTHIIAPQDFKDWEKLPQQAYEMILSQAKDRFEECLSESESITNKSIKFLFALFGFVAAFTGIIANKNIPAFWIVSLSILFLADTIYLAILVFPKNIIQRGSNPYDLFDQDLDDPDYSDDEKIRSIYFKECQRYQDRILKMGIKNNSRISFYKFAIWLFLFLLLFVLRLYLIYVFRP